MPISPQSKKYRYSPRYGKKVLHIFDEPYFALEDDDRCVTLTVSIPISLRNELEKYVKSVGIPTSRYIRILIEKDLELTYDVS